MIALRQILRLSAKDYASVTPAEGRELGRLSCCKHLMEIMKRGGLDVIVECSIPNTSINRGSAAASICAAKLGT